MWIPVLIWGYLNPHFEMGIPILKWGRKSEESHFDMGIPILKWGLMYPHIKRGSPYHDGYYSITNPFANGVHYKSGKGARIPKL